MRKNTKFIPSALAVLLGFVLTGCGDSTLATPAPEVSEAVSEAPSEEPSDPDLPSDEELELFVEALASEKIPSLEEAEVIVAHGSAAAGYLSYYKHQLNAKIDGGVYFSDMSGNVKSVEGGFEICYVDDEPCSEYTNFQGKDGVIVDFEVAGTPVSERLVIGGGNTAETFGGAEVELISAYMNAAGTHLIVGYDLSTGDEELDMPLITYRSEDGRQSESEAHYGMYTLSPESKSSYLAYFPGASLGGEVHLNFYSYDSYQEDTVVLPLTGE